MASKAEVVLGSGQVDAHLASLPPLPRGPLSKCPQDLGERKYARPRRCRALGKQDRCPHRLRAWAQATAHTS